MAVIANTVGSSFSPSHSRNRQFRMVATSTGCLPLSLDRNRKSVAAKAASRAAIASAFRDGAAARMARGPMAWRHPLDPATISIPETSKRDSVLCAWSCDVAAQLHPRAENLYVAALLQ
jgi:hypothetical protein